MGVQAANSHFTFQLPSMSYIDAKWEEPDLRVSAPSIGGGQKGRLTAWLSRQIAAFTAWRFDRVSAHELSSMSDRELLDIGLSRADIGRAFMSAFNEDLRQRGPKV